jgi:hypothetical protein
LAKANQKLIVKNVSSIEKLKDSKEDSSDEEDDNWRLLSQKELS